MASTAVSPTRVQAAALPGENVPAVPTFQDWARMLSFQPRAYFRPQSVDELRAWLEQVARGTFAPGSIRVPGSMHSCSDIYVTDALLDVNDLPHTIEFDADNGAVTASANWRLHDFLAALAPRGKSLTATGGTDAQTLAGLISTNTAPATPAHSLYDTLEWVEYLTIDPATKAVVERRASRGEPGYRAAVCSLGAIGVLTRVRFGLIEEPYFHSIQEIVPLADVLTDLDRTSASYDFWRINWVQQSDQGLLWTAKQIPKSQADPAGDYPADNTEWVLKAAGEIEKRCGGSPLLTPGMEILIWALKTFFTKVDVTGPLRNMLPVDRTAPVHVAMAEWSFDPADRDKLLATCRAYFDTNRWPDLPTEIELTKTDDHFMSPWNWQGLPYILKLNFQYLTDACNAQGLAEIDTHLAGLWAALRAAGIRFKAHWGKRNSLDTAFVSANYQLDQFRPYIQPLFVNPYLAARLGV
jgi:hypothetical protein